MKQLVSIVAIIIGATIISHASTRSDVNVLEASENIKYLTQKIAKDYLFFYTHQNKQEIQTEISKSVVALEKNIRTIAVTTKDPKTKQLLDFFAYEKEQMKSNMLKEPNLSNASSILDSSEAITEGANRIAKSIEYNFSFEEQMLIISKNIEYLIEKITKYYIVLGTDIDRTTIIKKMEKAIREIEDDLYTIKQYKYPSNINDKKEELAKLWTINKLYYSKVDSLKIPNIVLISTDNFKNIINEISTYHSKNQ